MIDALLDYFSKTDEEKETTVPEGICPNCWGKQEYGRVIRKMYVDKQIDVNNHESHHAFIKDFVVSKIDGIKLRKGKRGFECSTCYEVDGNHK